MNILNLFRSKPEIVEIQQAPNQLPLHVLKPSDDIPSIGKRNEEIINSITRARRVAVELARSGFHVLDITIGKRNPKIIINPSKRCEMLGGTMIKVTRLSQLEITTMAANIEGVQVEWMTPKNG